MLITRGESVQRNTSAEGVPAVQKQIQDLKDSWDALLSASIQCKRCVGKKWKTPSHVFQTAFWQLPQFFFSKLKRGKWTHYLPAAATVFAISCAALSDFTVLFKIISQLEGSLSQWTSYQEDVRQFVAWMERVEESLDPTDKQCPEMRDKTANLSKAKVLPFSQSYCILS